jgi:fibronectin type 3 domain-containing protein
MKRGISHSRNLRLQVVWSLFIIFLFAGFPTWAFGTLNFDGGDRVTVPNSPSLNPSQITVETWVKLYRLAPIGYWDNQFLITKGDDRMQGSYYLSANRDTFHFYIGANGVDQVYAATPSLIETNRWYHVAGTYDGSNVKIYVDGVLRGTTPASSIATGNTGLLTLGYHNMTGWEYYLGGSMGEVRIWSTARTESEIQADMYQELTSNEPTLAGYWKFDEGSGQVVHDYSNNGNNGQLGSTAGVDPDDPTWSSEVPFGIVQIPRTGQTTSYAAGDDGAIQAGVAWPSPRFTDNLDGTVTDRLTGLMWTKDAGTPTVGTCSGWTMTWPSALDYVTCLNTNNYLGHSDWRLPNINELKSLLNLGQTGSLTWLNSQSFNNVSSNPSGSFNYWSSTSRYEADSAWLIGDEGLVNCYWYTNYSYFVWPVRDAQFGGTISIPKTGQTTSYGTRDDGDLQLGVTWPDPRFLNNGNGTVTDNLTGLIWVKDANCFGARTWSQALNDANNLANGQCGLSDGSRAGQWHLPNRNELISLVDYSRISPALPAGHPFSNAAGNPYSYASSTTVAGYTDRIWTVGIEWYGYAGIEYKSSGNYYHVWPVRAGTVTGPITTHTITASAGANGNISPPGAVTVNHGDSQTFNITPDTNYHVADVLVDNVSQGAITTYTFNSVTADHTISATFAINSGTTPPTTTMSIDPPTPDGNNGWFKTEPLITLSRNEPGDTYWYYTAGYSFTYSAPFTAQDGQYTVYYYSVDTAGNVESAKQQSFKVDTIHPAIIKNAALNKPAYASSSWSSTPGEAFNGDKMDGWNSGTYAPAWIYVDLQQGYDITQIRLTVYQYPDGNTIHNIYTSQDASNWTLARTLNGYTYTLQNLIVDFSPPLSNVRYVKVETVNSPSWIGWSEIEVYETLPSISPANSATGVNISTNITATFSEDMDSSTINSSTFNVRDNANNLVPGIVSYNSSTRTATFDPSSNLGYLTTFIATVTTGVQDLAGNNLLSNMVWSFTTSSSSGDTTPPSSVTLSGNVVNSTRIDLSWTASTDSETGVDHYEIYNASNNSLIDSTSNTLYSHTGLFIATTYSYYVKAVDGAGNKSAASNTLRTTVLPCITQPWFFDFEPNNSLSDAVIGFPRNIVPSYHFYGFIDSPTDEDWYQTYVYEGQTLSLTIQVQEAGNIELGWSGRKPSGAILFQQTGLGKSIQTSTMTYTAQNGEAGLYSMKVWSNNLAGTRYDVNVNLTPQSDTLSPSNITGLTVTPVSNTEVNLSWSASTDNIGPVGYGICNLDTNLMVDTTTSTSIRLTNLTPGKTYNLGVTAADGGGNFSGPSTVSFTTGSIVTHIITASAGANGRISLSGTISGVVHNTTRLFTVTPNGGYQAVMSGTCGGSLVGTTYTTNPIIADCSVTATFNPISSNQPLPPGNNVEVQVPVALPSGGTGTVITEFDQIDTGGTLSITATDTPLGGGPPTGYRFLGTYYDVTYSGTFSGYIYVTFSYDDSSIPPGRENNLRLFHWEGGWKDVTYSLDTVNNKITGRVTSLSPFGIGYYLSSGGYSTGANENMIAVIAILAISAGLFILRRNRWIKA